MATSNLIYSVRKFCSVPNVTRRVTEPIGVEEFLGDDAVECSLAWSEQTHVVEAHLCQSTCKDQVEPTSAVNEYSSKVGALDDWIEY